jgi:hypothetical protein
MDTTTIFIKDYNHDDVSRLLESFDNVNLVLKSDGRHVKSAQHKNMMFYLGDDYLKVTGSLNKLVNDTNQFNFQLADVSEAIDYLSNLLDLDVGEAKVTRLDLGYNISLNQPVSNYLMQLSHSYYSKRHSVANETVEFRKHNRSLVFYDKMAELIAKKVEIASEFKNQNLLRYEIRLMSRLTKILNQSSLSLNMLKEAPIQKKLLRLWADEYLSVHKIYRPTANIDCRNTKTFVSSLASHGIKSIGGIETVVQHIDNVPDLAHTKRYRLYRKLRSINMVAADEPSRCLLDELSDKIQYIAANAA